MKTKETKRKCPICQKETREEVIKNLGWGCEGKIVYVCSCGWRSFFR